MVTLENRSQTHSQASPLATVAAADADAVGDTRCGYTIMGITQ